MTHDSNPDMDWVPVVTCKTDFIFKIKWQTSGGQLCTLGSIIDFS